MKTTIFAFIFEAIIPNKSLPTFEQSNPQVHELGDLWYRKPLHVLNSLTAGMDKKSDKGIDKKTQLCNTNLQVPSLIEHHSNGGRI